nr:odorant receptor 46a-like [Nomia melanderi]
MVGNYKMFNFHTKREAIMVLINNMRKRPFSAEDQAEKNIMTKYRKMIENKSTAYIVVIEIYLIVMWTTSLCRDPKERRLPIRGWIPYDYSTPILYGVTYCYQVLSTVSATFMHVANDILFSNLMLLIHCQLEILEYRLRQINNDDKGSARECARYHEYIYEFAAEVNKIFQGVLCFQFLASVGMICFNLYRITQTELGPRVYETCLYTVITLLQLFYYSWYGNEVRLKSLELPEMIIRSNWTNLDNETRKILLVIMLRATLPIEFTSAHVLSVNVETFMTVLKTSYSAYNVMQRPVTWTSTSKKLLYKVYTVLVLIILESLLLTLILDMVFNVENQDDFSDNLYALMPVITSSCKLCSFLANRERIMGLISKVKRKPHLPTSEAEMRIQIRIDEMNEKLATVFTSVFGSCVLIIWITSLIRDTRNRVLAFRAWVPYNYSSPTLYTVTYTHQALSVTVSSLMNIAYDTLFSGLMFSIYSQLEILGHRLRNIRSDQRGTARDFVAKMNERFELVLCVQFLTSALSMCFVLYQFTQSDGNARLAEMFMYAVCMLVEIFYYCWYGNEVRLKSLEIPDVIYASDWLNLDEKTKKTLLMIMIRSRIPMQFTSAHVVSMNIDTFMTVLKTSYSAYNVLQQR